MAEAAIQSAEIEQEAPRERVLAKRETGFWTVFVFTFSAIGLAYTGLLPFSKAAGIWPGSNLAVMLGTALLLAMINAYTFSVIGILAPQYGADYLVSSRVISAPLGFASSFTLAIFLAFLAGTYISSLVQRVVPVLFQTISLLTHEKQWLETIKTMTQPANLVSIGTVVVVLVFIISILPPRITRYILYASFVILLGVFGVTGFQILSASSASFTAAFEDAMGPGAYLGHLTTARSLGMEINTAPGQAVFAGLFLGYWIFYGYSNTALFAGEVKSPRKNLLFGNWAALLVSGGILMVMSMILQNAVPNEWVSAESYLSLSPDFHGQTMASLPFYLAMLRPNLILVWAVGIVQIVALLAMALAYIYAVTRLIAAWSNDGLVLEPLTAFHPALHSPTLAVLIVSIVVEAGLVFGILSQDTALNPVFFMAATQILPVIGLILLPFWRKEWFERAPGFVRAKLGPLPVISLAGTFSFVYLMWMMLSPLFFPTFSALNMGTIILFAVLFLAGLGWFFGRRRYLNVRGQSLDDFFKQIPIE